MLLKVKVLSAVLETQHSPWGFVLITPRPLNTWTKILLVIEKHFIKISQISIILAFLLFTRETETAVTNSYLGTLSSRFKGKQALRLILCYLLNVTH